MHEKVRRHNQYVECPSALSSNLDQPQHQQPLSAAHLECKREREKRLTPAGVFTNLRPGGLRCDIVLVIAYIIMFLGRQRSPAGLVFFFATSRLFPTSRRAGMFKSDGQDTEELVLSRRRNTNMHGAYRLASGPGIIPALWFGSKFINMAIASRCTDYGVDIHGRSAARTGVAMWNSADSVVEELLLPGCPHIDVRCGQQLPIVDVLLVNPSCYCPTQ